MSADGTNDVYVYADAQGAPSTGQWYFLFGKHDPDKNLISINVGGTGDPILTVNYLAHSTGIFQSTGDFVVGANGAHTDWWDGRIDSLTFFDYLMPAQQMYGLVGVSLDGAEWGE